LTYVIIIYDFGAFVIMKSIKNVCGSAISLTSGRAARRIFFAAAGKMTRFDKLMLTRGLFVVIMVSYADMRITGRNIDYEQCHHPSPGAAADEHISLKSSGKTAPATLTEGRIRRRYRRTILHFRGQAPDPYETPSLMEERSRLPDTPGMRSLHEEYERARYGPNSKKT
jgi:hypothetical protein